MLVCLRFLKRENRLNRACDYRPKILIVGAGFTGCVTALNYARAGYPVILWEAAPHIGGIVRDLEFDGDWFFAGCHYLDLMDKADGILPWSIVEKLQKFDHIYGSLSVANNTDCVNRSLAGPVLPTSTVIESVMQFDEEKARDAASINDRLELHEHDVADFLKACAGRSGLDLNSISASSAVALGVKQIGVPADGELELLETRKRVGGGYSYFAVSHSARGVPQAESYYPPRGYNKVLKHIQQELVDNGVDLKLGSPFTPRRLRELIDQQQDTHPVKTVLVWCANPTVLMHHYGLPLESVSVKICLVAGEIVLDARKVCSPVYFQIFDPNSPVYRIYVYPDGHRVKFTAECYGATPKTDIIQLLEVTLAKFDMAGKVTVVGSKVVNAYSVVSVKDRLTMQRFEEIKMPWIVSGGWEEYARMDKIQKVFDQIDELISGKQNRKEGGDSTLC